MLSTIIGAVAVFAAAAIFVVGAVVIFVEARK